MSKNWIIIFAVLIFSLNLVAENWKIEADASFSMNQNSYSDNWSGDEKGSISWISNINFLAEKQLNPSMLNKNTAKLAFGQTHNQYIDAEGEKQWQKPDKTTDQIELEGLMLFTLNSFVDPYAGLKFESQFLDQSVIDETKSINPITLTESFGISRFLIKEEKKEFSTRLGGAFKQYLNSHDAIDNTNDGGIEFVSEYKTPLANEAITFNSNLNIYKAMFYSESDAVEGTEFEDAWKAPRMNWENILSASITKLINLNLNFTLKYNEMELDNEGEIIDEIQYKQTLSLGISYKFL